ncbi:hypothetical protein H4683_002468 [Filibacter limicola]|uniref:Uncharacterized protein n=1 Tax=Sporosarcina limicola TaxID=34101 RepID=A0A927R4W8_9BACL|nr:hypothetical protein [Sporosarcina limicola]
MLGASFSITGILPFHAKWKECLKIMGLKFRKYTMIGIKTSAMRKVLL